MGVLYYFFFACYAAAFVVANILLYKFIGLVIMHGSRRFLARRITLGSGHGHQYTKAPKIRAKKRPSEKISKRLRYAEINGAPNSTIVMRDISPETTAAELIAKYNATAVYTSHSDSGDCIVAKVKMPTHEQAMELVQNNHNIRFARKII